MTKKSFWDNTNLQQDIKWDNQELPGIPDEVLLTKNWNKVDASRERANNPKWKEKYYDNPDWLEPLKKKRAESLKTEEMSKKLSESHKKRYQDPNERIKTANATKKSYAEDPTRLARAKSKSKKTWATEEVRKKASESHKKQWQDPNKRQQLSTSMKEIRKYAMMCKGQWFESSQAAADHFGISRDMIGYYRKKYPDQYYYCDKKPHSNKKKSDPES